MQPQENEMASDVMLADWVIMSLTLASCAQDVGAYTGVVTPILHMLAAAKTKCAESVADQSQQIRQPSNVLCLFHVCLS